MTCIGQALTGNEVGKEEERRKGGRRADRILEDLDAVPELAPIRYRAKQEAERGVAREWGVWLLALRRIIMAENIRYIIGGMLKLALRLTSTRLAPSIPPECSTRSRPSFIFNIEICCDRGCWRYHIHSILSCSLHSPSQGSGS